MRSEESFELFYKMIEIHRQKVGGVDEPVLPRKRKAPHQFEVGSSDSFHTTVDS